MKSIIQRKSWNSGIWRDNIHHSHLSSSWNKYRIDNHCISYYLRILAIWVVFKARQLLAGLGWLRAWQIDTSWLGTVALLLPGAWPRLRRTDTWQGGARGHLGGTWSPAPPPGSHAASLGHGGGQGQVHWVVRGLGLTIARGITRFARLCTAEWVVTGGWYWHC